MREARKRIDKRHKKKENATYPLMEQISLDNSDTEIS
jgi:hypothetical protein